MKLKDLSLMRLDNQQISARGCATARETISRMGAVQAQDLVMARWAVGIRMDGSTESAVIAAIDKGEILRTHVMRPTWHLVVAEDIRWMIRLTAPRIRSALGTRHRYLEITEPVMKKVRLLLTGALKGGNHLTRQEINQVFKKAGIGTEDNRVSHLLLMAELDEYICSGAEKEGKPTYALLDERAPMTSGLPSQQAMEKLALRYFESHGPATLQDFIWWSGLSASDARNTVEALSARMNAYTLNGTLYLSVNPPPHSALRKQGIYVLPAYDEFLISYRNREAALPSASYKRVISINGIFWPVIVVNGKVAGLWKRKVSNGTLLLEADLFRKNPALIPGISKALTDYARFTGHAGPLIRFNGPAGEN